MTEKRATWINDLKRFRKNPAKPGSDHALKTSQRAAIDIAHQTLRLYPSTRHAYRVKQVEGAAQPFTYSVDVQAVQRANCDLRDAFVPEVNQDKSIPGIEHSHNFLAFGAWNFKCPAGSDFGERMVALLIAAMV